MFAGGIGRCFATVPLPAPSGGRRGIFCGLIAGWKSRSCVHGSEMTPVAHASDSAATAATAKGAILVRFNTHLLGSVGAHGGGDGLGVLAAARHPDSET